MRVKSLKLTNVANIEELYVDFEAYGPGVIALVGNNGSGKTHLMESMVTAPLFREWVSSPKSGAKKATAGEAFIDHCWSGDAELVSKIGYNGEDFTLTLKASPTINKQEAYFEKNGETVNTSGKLSEYDLLISKTFPTKDIILSAPFASQNNIGSLFGLDRDARRTLFVRLLGVEEYEIIAKEATDLARSLAVELAELENTVSEQETWITANTDSVSRYKNIQEELHLKREELESVRSECDYLLNLRESNLEEYEKYIGSRPDNSAYIGSFEYQPELLEKAEVAAGELPSLEKEFKEVSILEDAIIRERKAINEAGVLVKSKLETLVNNQRALEKLYSVRISTLDSRQESEVRTSQAIRGVDLTLSICRKCPLTKNSRMSKSNLVLIDEIREVEKKVYEYQSAQLEALINDGYSLLQDLTGHWERMATRLLEIGNRLADLAEEISKRKNILSQAESYKESLAKFEATINRELDRQIAVEAGLQPWIMEAFLAWYDQIGLEYEMAFTKGKAIYDSIGQLEKRAGDLEPYDRMTRERQRKIESAQEQMLPLRELIEDNTQLSDLLLYMRTARIEAAIPEVEKITNSLLTAYEGGRFRLHLLTSTKGRNAAKEKDDFIPVIFDTKDGVYKKRGSGGQQAMFDEALRLAICIENMRYHNMGFETLIRDETTAHVTRDYAADYVKMLRKAQEEGGFYQIIFVTHHESIWPQADAIIRMEHGKIIE